MPKSSTSFLFPDVNVWLALTYERHAHHPAATAWFGGLGSADRLCFCRFTQLSLLRLLTTEAVMGRDDVLSQIEAWESYDEWRVDGRVLFLEEPAGLEQAFRSLARRSHPAPKDWADAYVAGFASAGGLVLVTFDRALREKSAGSVLLRP